MCAAAAQSIPLEKLDKLSQVYTKNWPKHIIIHSTLQLFIKQLQKFPELEQRLKFFALSSDWENDGLFYATVSVNLESYKERMSGSHSIFSFKFVCSDVETFVFFDSLSDSENDAVLKTALEKLEYARLIDFFSIRNEFSHLALGVMKDLNLQCIEETNAICFFLPKNEALNLEIS